MSDDKKPVQPAPQPPNDLLKEGNTGSTRSTR